MFYSLLFAISHRKIRNVPIITSFHNFCCLFISYLFLLSDIIDPYERTTSMFKDVPGGLPKSDLLGVTVALIHVVL